MHRCTSFRSENAGSSIDTVRYSHESASLDSNDTRAKALNEAHTQGRVWAEIASQMALVKADTNSLTTVRTCEQLALYWIAVGERDRANCHAGMDHDDAQLQIIWR